MARVTQTSPAVYVIAGKDSGQVRQKCRRLVASLLEPDQRSLGLVQFDGKSLTASDVLDEVRTLPFLASRRVVVVHDADAFITSNRSALEAYFDKPCPTGTLILCVQSWMSTTKLAKKLAKAGELIKLDPPKPWQMPKSLVAYTQQEHQKRLTARAAELLVHLAGDDWGRVCGEVDKLALFVDRAPGIDVEQIEKLVGHNRVYGAFDVIDSVTAGRRVEAIERLRNLFAEDPASQYTIVGAFAYHIRRLYAARVLWDRGTRPDQIAKELKLWGRREALLRQVQRWSLERIGGFLAALAEIDHAVKTGRMRVPIAVEQLVHQMTDSGR